MSTPCYIGKLNEKEKTFMYISCKWGGYKEEVGDTLEKFYTTEDRVNRLILNGNLSQIGRYLSLKEKKESGAQCSKNQHTFINPENGVCVFYKRDYKMNVDDIGNFTLQSKSYEDAKIKDMSEYQQPTPFDCIQKLISENDCRYIEYAYIFSNGKWGSYKLIP